MSSVQAPVGWEVVSAAAADRATASEVGSSTAAEVRVRRQRAVGLYEGDTQAPGLGEGTATLTSWSVFFRCDAAAGGGATVDLRLPLESVVDLKPYAGVKFFSSPKIVVSLSGTPHGRPSFTKISFRQGGQPEFLADMRVMLEKRRWLAAAPTPVPAPTTPQPQHGASTSSPAGPQPARGAPNSAPAGRTAAAEPSPYAATTTGAVSAPADGQAAATVTERAGIRGLVDRRDAQYESQQSALRTATADMDELVNNAPQVQAIVRSLRASGSAGRGGDAFEARQGIAAPVTREVAGKGDAAWHAELSSELCLWLLRHPTLRARPVVPVAELFAMYNRARGAMHALPPSDVLAACTGLEQGSLAAQARGAAQKEQAAWFVETDEVGVVQLRQLHAKHHALQHVAQLLAAGLRATASPTKRDPSAAGFDAPSSPTAVLATADEALPVFRQGVRAAELASRMHVSVDEALEMLEELEDDGVLCRGAPRGLNAASMRPLFYWNPFTSPGAAG